MKVHFLASALVSILTIAVCAQPSQSASRSNRTNTSSRSGTEEARSSKTAGASPSDPDNTPAAPTAPVSLCTASEQVLLNWQVIKTGKLVSLCASKDFGKDAGYIQYRFGRPGNIELEFPKDATATQAQFGYSHYFRARVDRTDISFKTDRKYTLSDDYEGEGGKNLHSYTVTVETPDGKGETEIKCKELQQSKLDKLQEALPNQDSDQ